MVGCMLATSLGMAPAFLLSPMAQVIDLDGPLLLKRDREPGIRFEGSLMYPPLGSALGLTRRSISARPKAMAE